MLKAELFEIVANGENSGVEFKRDDLISEEEKWVIELFLRKHKAPKITMEKTHA